MLTTSHHVQRGMAVLALSSLLVCVEPFWNHSTQPFLGNIFAQQGQESPAHNTAAISKTRKTLSEDTLAALTVYLEARGESFAGKLAVAAVIRNRMKFKYHSDGTVRGTVLRPKQFQPWNRRRPHQVLFDPNESNMRDSMLAWRMVQDGRKVVKDAVLFFNPRLVRSPKWAIQGRMVASVGGHDFYVPSKKRRI